MPRFLLPAFFVLLVQTPLSAAPIAQFPETTTPEAAPCYFKTSDGRGFDLSSICGKSEASYPPSYQSPQNQSAATNSGALNPGFRAALNANPGNPFGSNPNLAQCYIVDDEGNPCQP
jgi:hypothetical protein